MTALAQNTVFTPFAGAGVVAEEFIATGRVKGTIVSAHVHWVKERRSVDDYIAFWNAIPREARTEIGMVLPLRWYDFAHLMAIDHAILDLFGDGSNTVLRELGAHSARANLVGAIKAFNGTSIHEFFGTSARLHAQFQDFGEAAYTARNESSGLMSLTGYTSYSPLFCASALGFYEEAIILHGGSNVIVTEATCQCRGDRACSFVMRWR